DRLRGIIPECLHHRSYLLLPIHSLFGNGDQVLKIKSMLHIQVKQLLKQASPLFLFIRRHLAKKSYSADSIFVPNLISYHQSKTFFSSNNVVLFSLFLAYHFSDPFKTGQHIVTFHPTSLCYLIDHLSSNNCFDHHIIWLRYSLCLSCFNDVIKSKHRSLISIHQHPLTMIIFYTDPYPVGVRVSSQ